MQPVWAGTARDVEDMRLNWVIVTTLFSSPMVVHHQVGNASGREHQMKTHASQLLSRRPINKLRAPCSFFAASRFPPQR